ncbi:MAG: DUF1761 domain-containing protein [Saprospiraceae bacterium]|nr:DUF1761 domain-containing protein [Saprospiraceae bacterium]
MMNQLSNLNWLSILIAFFAFFMLGYVWYVLLFSKQYKISLGKENETLPTSLLFIIGPAVCSIGYILASAILLYALNIKTYAGALEFSLIIGIGYLVSNTVNIAINPNIPRPFFYGLISGSYFLVGITIVNVILVAMK